MGVRNYLDDVLTLQEALDFLLLMCPTPTTADQHWEAFWQGTRTLAIAQGHQDDASSAERKLRLATMPNPYEGQLQAIGGLTKAERDRLRLHGVASYEEALAKSRSHDPHRATTGE